MLPAMNGNQQTVAAGEPCAGNIPWRQVVAILAAAVALGLIYNVASPLGVRAPKQSQAAGSPLNSNTHALPLAALIVTNSASAQATPVALAANPSASSLRWVEVKPLLAASQIVLVDARATAAYEIEHIPGAVSLPVNSAPAEFLAFATKYPKDTAIVTYCGSDNCDLSQELAEKLRRDLGFTNVKEMLGGIAEYRLAEGKPNPSGQK
jgi:rhodanese-related sulfurtransferase